MSESKAETQLKSKATNWLLTTLIGVVSWIGKEQNDALKQISSDLQTVSGTVQVHTAEISNLKKTSSDLQAFMYEKQYARHEEIYEYPKREK